MKLFEDQCPLPEGLWLVKWIDLFRFGHDAESLKVDVALQKLPFTDVTAADLLSGEELAELLGKKPSAAASAPPVPPVIIVKPLLAAYIPSINVGDVFQGSDLVGRLPQISRRVVLDSQSEVRDLRIGSTIPAPPDWSAGEYRVLNRFEYQLGSIPAVERSRCLVFRQKGTEYILPKMAIFRAFYCLSSSLINALYDAPWPHRARDVISFKQYDSGITTGRCSETGSWKIVLKDRTLLPMVHALALLWFDEHGRKHAESLHSDARRQSDGTRGADGRSWHANANIPHRFEPLPFEMGLNGFSLRPFQPSRRHETIERFLVASITGSSWSLPDQLIEFELDGSNAKGEEQSSSEEDRPYRRGKPSVEGDPDAVATSVLDPNPNEATNLFLGNSFEYFNEPKVREQKKQSSKTYPKPRKPQIDAAASLVAGGASGSAGSAPAPAEVAQMARSRSHQFEFLVRALNELKAASAIQSFEAISTTDAGLAIQRNGLDCWSLLPAKNRKVDSIPKRGWEVVHESAVAESVSSSKPQPVSRHARSVLIVRVRLQSRDLILLEIEPRPQESAYCLIAFEQDRLLVPWTVGPALDAIRHYEGRFRDVDLASAFATITSNKVVAIRHFYTYTGTEKDELKVATGLRSDILEKSLVGILFSQGACPAASA